MCRPNVLTHVSATHVLHLYLYTYVGYIPVLKLSNMCLTAVCITCVIHQTQMYYSCLYYICNTPNTDVLQLFVLHV